MQNKLILYIAMSLDGYIADQGGGVGFLYETPSPTPDLGYEAFYRSIQAIIMGGTTYRQVKNELSPNEWPYAGTPCYICTRQQAQDGPDVRFTQLPPRQLLQAIWAEHPGSVWLMGGGKTIRSFLDEDLIDEYIIYVQPVLLGGGIPLFPAGFPKTAVTLKSCQRIGDIVELIYQRAGGPQGKIDCIPGETVV